MSVAKTKNGYLVQTYYTKKDGTRGRLSKRVKRYSDVARVKAELEEMAKKYSDYTLTFDDLIKEYIDWLKNNRRLTTSQNAGKKLKNHVLPYFRHVKVRDLDYVHVQRWKERINSLVSDKTSKPLTLVYKRNLYTAFHGLMSFALKAYGIENNALQRAGNFIADPNAKPEEKKLHYWTAEKFTKFTSAMMEIIDEDTKRDASAYDLMENQGILVFYHILFYGGLRRGEANALQIKDFHDGEHPYLSITKSVSMKNKIDGKYLVTNPKNTQSVRNVPIPRHLAELLRDHIDNMKLCYEKEFQNDFFLCGGRQPIPDTTADLLKEEAEKRAGLPHIRVHDLRHSYASLLINKGTDISVISRLMGHGSTDITYKIYSHFYPETNYTAIEGIDDLMGESETKDEKPKKKEEEMEL